MACKQYPATNGHLSMEDVLEMVDTACTSTDAFSDLDRSAGSSVCELDLSDGDISDADKCTHFLRTCSPIESLEPHDDMKENGNFNSQDAWYNLRPRSVAKRNDKSDERNDKSDVIPPAKRPCHSVVTDIDKALQSNPGNDYEGPGPSGGRGSSGRGGRQSKSRGGKRATRKGGGQVKGGRKVLVVTVQRKLAYLYQQLASG